MFDMNNKVLKQLTGIIRQIMMEINCKISPLDYAKRIGVNLSPLSRQKIGLFMVHNQATCFDCCFNSSLK